MAHQRMSSNDFMGSPEAMEIISTIRALTVSQKDMISEQDLMRDYKQLNGEPVPYRKFGFKSLEQFLVASSEFLIRRNAQNGISISAKPSQESSHIVALIQKQKSNSSRQKKRIGGGGGGFRRPVSADQSWQKAQYTNVFAKLPSPKKSLQSFVQRNSPHRSSSNPPPRSLNNNTNLTKNRNFQAATNKENLDNFQLVTTQNFNVQDVRAKGREHLINETKKIAKSQSVSRQNSREQPLQQRQPLPPSKLKQQVIQQDWRGGNTNQANHTESNLNVNKTLPVVNNNNICQSNSSNNRPINNISVINSKPSDESNRIKLQSRIDMANAIAKHHESSDLNKKITIRNDPPKNISPLTSLQVTIPTHNHSSPLLRGSIQDRLIVNKKILQPFDNAASNLTVTSPSVRTPPTPTYSQLMPELTSVPPVPVKIVALPPRFMTPTDELACYCDLHGYAEPIYKLSQIYKSHLFHCKVTVNGCTYSTYPESVERQEGKSRAAEIALAELKDTENRQLFPVCVESEFNVAIKIYNILKDYPNGVFSANFPDKFQKAYQNSLPEKWFSIVASSPQLFSVEETTTPSIYILFALVRDSGSSSVSTTSDSDSTSVIEKLTLPWHLEHWDLYITNPVSTIQIWARIIGEEYSEKLDSLSTDIDLAMLTDKERAQTVQIGYIYLICISDCWYRVRINELDYEQNRAFCFFIDVGDEDWYPLDQLFVCESSFMQLPAQAITFSLFGLEDFDENPYAKHELVDLAGKLLIGKVFTKQEEYEMLEESSNFDARIKIVLYDTSSDEDLNLNSIILQNICKNTPPPQFERSTVTHVNITYVKENGDIYCQIKDSGICYIEKLINNLTVSKLNEELHSGLYPQDKSSMNKYYLVYDETDKRWYRAIIESLSRVEDEYKLFYVDYGISRSVKTKRILRTDSLSAALHRFPQQAVRIRLAGIQLINEDTVARLRGLLKPDAQALIKIISQATIPLVSIFVRLQPNNVLLNVNETIQLEQELEQTSEINQNVANLKLNLSSSTNSTTLTSSSAYRSPQTMGSNSSISSSKTNISKNGANTSLGNSPESVSSLNDLSTQFKSIDLKSQSTPSGGGKLDLPKLKPAVHPPIGQLTFVRVSMASNPSYFVIQPNDDAAALHELMAELQTYCINSKEFIPSDCVKVGEVYGALHADGSWYRATVENIYEPTMIHIFYCDYGDVTVLSSDKLKILPFQFRKLPRQASKARLYGIKPKFGDWLMEDCIYFQELTVSKVFAATVRSIVEDEMNKEEILELILADVSGDSDILIHKLLIEENRAAPC